MSSRKIAKEVWLEEGLKILETKGPGALSIENLTLATGKTKGSFYHHFGSREGYIEHLLEYYEMTTTKEVIETLRAGNDTRDSLKKLTKTTFQLSSALELAIRAWALYDPMVRNFQDRLDRTRLEYLIELHRSLGAKADEAWNRSHRDYALFIGLHQIRHHHNEKDFRKLLKTAFSGNM